MFKRTGLAIDNETGEKLQQGKYDIVRRPYIEINSLEQLMDFIKDVDEDVIVSDGRIMIYDGCIE